MPRVIHDPLTDQQVKALKPGAIPIDVRDGEQRGLIVTVLPSGRKQFTVRYRIGGKQKRLILGDYPGLSLAKARKRARAELTGIDNGTDPVAVQQEAKRAPTDTIETLAKDYLKRHAKTKRTAAEDERILNVDVLPFWRDRSVRDLTRRDVRALIERVTDRGAAIMANRVLALVRRMLNFAIDHDWIEANPAARVQKPAPESSRDRVLTHEEIRRLWRVLSHFPTTQQKPAPGRKRTGGDPNDPLCPISPALAAILKVRLLTAQRGGEVARMRWVDLDLDAGWWTIPGQHTKNGRPHRVPLTTDALDLIRVQLPENANERGETVFTGRGGSTVLDRAKKAPSEIARALGIEFRGHDLRRTAATNMAAAGILREHISRVLNHIEGGPRATKVYDRYAYDAEKRIAVECWTRRLKEITALVDGSANVVPFAKRV